MKYKYMENMYLKEFETIVENINNKVALLKDTIFYPKSGGVANDIGKLIRLSDNKEFKVIYVGKFLNNISHEFEPVGLRIGDKIKCYINWNRRYKLMRSHTSAHLLAALFHKLGAKITGNNIDVDKSRMDFNLENFDRELILKQINRANDLIKLGANVKTYYLLKDKVFNDPNLIKLANTMPPDLKELRIVKIEGIDEQVDGGCHVKNINEIGKILLIKIENKGKNNRRVYFKLEGD